MSSPFLGQLLIVGFDFAPIGWAICAGQILPISPNTALFALLGTQFGGNGINNFGLPNLQGNISNGQGQGPGLSPYYVGETAGVPQVTLLNSNMAAHNHAATATAGRGITVETSPISHVLAEAPGGINIYAAATAPLDSQLNVNAIGPSGGTQPHNNLMPFQCLNWLVCLQGIFPQRG